MRKLAILATLFLAGCGHGLKPDPAPIKEITAMAHARSTGDVVEASLTLSASDPAMVRLYAWPSDQAGQVEAEISMNDGRLGRWALGPIVSLGVQSGADQPIELRASARKGWLYAVAIEPVSMANGAAFSVRSAVIRFEGN